MLAKVGYAHHARPDQFGKKGTPYGQAKERSSAVATADQP